MLVIQLENKKFEFELNERLNIEKIDNECCVYNKKTKKMSMLNLTATIIFLYIKSSLENSVTCLTVDDIVSHMKEKINISDEALPIVHKDIQNTLTLFETEQFFVSSRMGEGSFTYVSLAGLLRLKRNRNICLKENVLFNKTTGSKTILNEYETALYLSMEDCLCEPKEYFSRLVGLDFSQRVCKYLKIDDIDYIRSVECWNKVVSALEKLLDEKVYV